MRTMQHVSSRYRDLSDLLSSQQELTDTEVQLPMKEQHRCHSWILSLMSILLWWWLTDCVRGVSLGYMPTPG